MFLGADVAGGQFLKVEPGAAKLLGVLSLQALPRRLVLDFRDVFSDGFAFDFVRGDARIEKGVLFTNNLQMKGVNAAVLMEGTADIAREAQDLKVVVVPEINAGTASLKNTIVAGNSHSNCANSGTLTSLGHNLDSANTCNFGAAGDLTGVNPILGVLASNGGPTKTMRLNAGSPAIDHGSNTTCASKDQRGVARPQGPTCDIGAYEVHARTFRSVGTYDGWVLESGKATNLGGSLNSTAGTFLVGDDAGNRRYRGFLSFDTSALPDAASIVLAKVSVKKQSVTGNPFGTQGTLLADLRKPYFGAGLPLVNSDWQASATVSSAATFASTLVSGFYSGPLNSSGRSNINKTGTTQFRLRFSTDAYNAAADYLSLFSGNYATVSYRPFLIVYYNP